MRAWLGFVGFPSASSFVFRLTLSLSLSLVSPRPPLSLYLSVIIAHVGLHLSWGDSCLTWLLLLELT